MRSIKGALVLIAWIGATTACNQRMEDRGTRAAGESELAKDTAAAAPADPDRLLPPLDNFNTDDSAEAGELVESLNHAAIPYEEVRRRLLLDDQGFAVGEVTVVTFEPGADIGDRYLNHRYGEVPRSPVSIAGEEMLRIQADPYGALAWIGPSYVVTFERGAGASADWLEELARSTVESIRARENQA